MSVNSSNNISAPPPSYISSVYKLENSSSHNFDGFLSLPPSYSSISNPSITYGNNYPGPPSEDGTVQTVVSHFATINHTVVTRHSLTKQMRIYIYINDVIIILFGLGIIGLQIGLVASNSFGYHYYGFWAGAILVFVGIIMIMYNSRSHQHDLKKYFHYLIWQSIFISIVLGFGILIITVGRCNDEKPGYDANENECKHSYKVLDELLLSFVILSILQSIMNILVVNTFKRRYFLNV